MMSLTKKIYEKYNRLPMNAKASVWFLISSFFQRGISVITTPVFTRVMTPEEYGKFNVWYSWYGIIAIFVTLNIYYGCYTRGLVRFENDRRRFTSSLQGLCLCLCLLWLVVYILFYKQFNKIFASSSFQMICMLLIIWSNAVYSFWAAGQRVDVKYKSLVALSMLSAVLVPIVQLGLMAFFEDKVYARIIGLAAVSVSLYTPLFFKEVHLDTGLYSKQYWKYALAFNLPLIPHYLSQVVLNSSDRLMINAMIGSREAGIYSLAYSVSQIMTVFNSAMMQSIEPWLYKKIRDNKVKDISAVAYLSFVLIAFVNLAIIAFAPEIIAIFAPKSYYEAIWVIPPVSMSVFFGFMYSFFAVFEFYYEKTKYIASATMVGAVINVLLNCIFIKKYGYYAAGYTTLICFILYALLHYVFSQKLIKKHFENIEVYNTKYIL